MNRSCPIVRAAFLPCCHLSGHGIGFPSALTQSVSESSGWFSESGWYLRSSIRFSWVASPANELPVAVLESVVTCAK